MKKVTPEEATAIAEKLNELIQKSYRDKTIFDMEDVLKTGMNKTQAKVIMADLVKDRTVFTLMGKFSVHPQVLAELKFDKEIK